MNVQSSSTIEFTDEEPKSALSEVLEALRHPDGPGAGIKALGFLWEKNSAARYRRFYYEQILQRTADSAISARAPVSNPGAAIAEMLCSDEFINGSVGTLANEYRHLKRMIYVHIPKSGGTTVMNAFIDDPRHAIVYMPRAIFEGHNARRMDILAEEAKALHDPRVRNIVFFGHPTVRDIMLYKLKRGTDTIFSTIRDPIDSAISALNYSITLINEYSDRADSLDLRKQLGLTGDRKLETRDELANFAEVFFDKILMGNIACATLGREPTANSAIEWIQILGIEIFPISALGALLNRFGVPTERIDNKSTEYVKFEQLPLASQVKLYNIFSEDLKLFYFLERKQWRL
ncbi:hypothetical protein IYY11_00400 [Methylocystis sp. H62]|uniref:hypothetical protein n=1 Tax=Methylocystis sp. H62 TaxID=2785789 RepID=UPI0018C34300|nr:hypothetical protein [Methylocystis sp. H62]MBG0791970.1 hypothetical protein [Methylocystis sp. H62]